MNRYVKAVAVLFALMLGLGTVPVVSGGDEHDHAHRPGAPEKKDNPLIVEMVKLDAVFRDVVSGVAVSDGSRVHSALEGMRGTMEKTHEGVHEGTVTLHKNADRLKEFVAIDRQFHDKLDRLDQAAIKRDEKAMVVLTKELLDGCVQCHAIFRNP